MVFGTYTLRKTMVNIGGAVYNYELKAEEGDGGRSICAYINIVYNKFLTIYFILYICE